MYDEYLSIVNDISTLPGILDKHREIIKDSKDHIKVKDKTPGNIVSENMYQASYLSYYDELRIHIKKILKYLTIKEESEYGKYWRMYTENFSRELNSKDKEHYIKNEKGYNAIRELVLEVSEIYEQYDSIVNALNSKGYALNNITKILTAKDLLYDQ